MVFEKQENNLNIWLPEEANAELIGEVTSIKQGEYGNSYAILKEDAETIDTPAHKVLQNRMSNVKVGDIVKLVYTGSELPKVKGNNPTKMYDVFIDVPVKEQVKDK